MPERQGVGEGEAKGLYKSALNAPSWLPRAPHCLARARAQPATVPWQIKTSHTHTHTQNPNLLANKIPPVNTLKKCTSSLHFKEFCKMQRAFKGAF